MIVEALKEINRGSAEVIDTQRVEKLLGAYFENGQTYTVKAGFDPTAPDLHLGHTVLLQKLAVFQKYGARVQFLIGSFTATIGDPTGKNITRKVLSKEEIEKNIKSYTTQAFKILDESKTDIVYNDDWLGKMSAADMITLASHLTVARMLERDDFSKRFKSNTPIATSEFMYPLLQGYDSVYLNSDIEIGGTDQKFNLLMGRQLQKAYNSKKQQAVLMMPILEGLDGVQKMSKSLGNYIGVADEPNEMFGKVLSVSDELMWRYYELLSTKSLDEIEALKNGVADGSVHPKKVKESLASEIVTRFHSEEAAYNAKLEFERVHAKSQIPTEMNEFSLEGETWIAKALVECNISPSTSQARRDIKQGAVKINQEKISDEQLQLGSGDYILQVGKRKFAKLKVI
ncbi:MAG: tyrosine--tRNA ligase [Epsilonproteobacteria bacterium]|nr:tyrosine--tRNA ligase [Campylobacterota bacterium]OIO17679.1 MAG: tyrosine--tRNA ligase [Helicobacteraceae bacterium CG1_02_36_14]PIP09671.1 MAG: tyrosine--tRNA ligase [Sulfurimonas sp. CG23_combo_of_CG06-09_8_20_14_all_36_33]PIS26216.1 MAG: tyrosine--tRNA ligase [Sulfurimonas sp. CG08_land_8_20_14_0_20_36_33]PIU34300.1 MAG: tyrosine--tRNA ligase [Sulfurimonas sp. CG07_land_8_20_14_0_80_36_56]PIV02598.1 MAG: tyrosine--tRNA ligase [Sulfurimonas sp. CG03_land_8_20_14_0_80_36_25]PIV34695.1 MA